MSDDPALAESFCPNCKRRFRYDPRHAPVWLPFCRERCQWIDLGRWMSEDYRVSKDVLSDDDEQID